MAKGNLSIKLAVRFITVFVLFGVGSSLYPKFVLAQSDTFDSDFFPAPQLEPELPELFSGSSTDSLVEDTYILGVGDTLRVSVFNIPDYSGEFRVLSGGSLNMPVIGPLSVEGLSVQQATDYIEQRLEAYVRRPHVTLSVIEARPMQIAIAGEVHRPGAYQVSAGNIEDELPTLTQAIELASGITQLADIRRIEVKRRIPGVVNGAQVIPSNPTIKVGKGFQTIPIDLWGLLKDGDLSKDLQLQDGDQILIPTASRLNADEVTELATASFSPDQISVNVVGEVEAPGSISIPPNSPLNQAILAAGGFNNRARKATVNLVRLNPNGTASEREIDVNFAQGVNEETNPSLRPNDTVIVRRSGLARTNDTLGGILAPLNFGVNILRLFGL